jgi:hypothetical protein
MTIGKVQMRKNPTASWRARVLTVGLLLVAASPLRADEAAQGGRKPGWVRALETANPYVFVAMDASGGATESIQGTKELRASEIARREGNREVRKVLAAERNALRQSGLTMAKAAEKLGTAATVADVGGTLAGHLIEGDLRAVPGVAANAAAKSVTASGGAWAGGTAGAAAGSLFGPVGTLVGGAIGAAAGAVGASWGYDATNEALARNGHQSLQGFVDSLAAERPVDYVEKARQAREEHLMAQAEERSRAETRRNVELPEQIEKAREARREYLEAERHKAEEWHEKQDRRAATTPENQTPTPPVDPSKPVIPVDCTIDVVMWNTAASDAKWHGTFRVNGDSVTLHAENTFPGSVGEQNRSGPMRVVNDFTGTRRDNVISGTNHTASGPTKSEVWWNSTDGKGASVRRHCVVDWSGRSTTEEEWTFELGGRGRLRLKGHGTTTCHYSAGCDHKPGGDETDGRDFGDEDKLHFSWTIR